MKERIYRKLIEDSPIPYIHLKMLQGENKVGKQIKVLDINKSFEHVFKTSKDKAINADVEKILNDEEYARLVNRLNIANSQEYSTFIVDELGGSFLNLEIYTFEKDEYHIRATRMNRYSNQLSTMIKQSPFAVWVKDRDGRYIDVNRHYLRSFNIQGNHIIGKLPEEVWEIEEAKSFREKDKKVIQDNMVYRDVEVITVDKDKSYYFEVVRWPYTDETGNTILGTMGIAIEVTDKIKLREAIEKNQKNFFDMANNIDELIIIRDAKKALYISPYFEQLYGFKPDALYEDMENWYKHWDYIEFLEEPKAYEYKEIDTCIFRVLKNGQVDKWIQSKFVPIFDEHGNTLRKIGMLRDITDKKNIEDELENLRMEFFANISHELRTPINIIISALQMMNYSIEQLEQSVLEDFRRYMNLISQNSLRMLRLVNNLIDTTKINAGHFEYKPTNQDIISFVEDICTSVIDFVERNQLEIIFDTDVEEKLVAFDMDQMERIILNLISNAIKFNQEHGKIEVTICTEDQIKISVKDSGLGIPQDKLENIFERFEQVDKKHRREKEGSGIGLALVKSLVEMHEGTIEVISTVGQGSEFIITLPEVLMPEEIENENKASHHIGQGHKVDVEFSDIYL